MDLAVTAKTTATPWSRVLFVLVTASLACAPVSWIVDGVTPSMILYPVALLVGLWRRGRGAGTLYFGIAGTIFLLVHLPFTWAVVTGADTNPANRSQPTQPTQPVEWLVILFLVPLATAIVGFVCWRRQRH